MSSLKGTVPQSKLSGTLQELLSEYDSILEAKGLQYATEIDLACELIRRGWSSRGTMTPLWEQFYGGAEHFAVHYGTKTEEFQRFLDSREETFVNFILTPLTMLVGKPDSPVITHVMLDSDWDDFWKNVICQGSDYIDEIQRNRLNIGIDSWGRSNKYDYRGIICNMLRQHIDRDNMKIYFGSEDLRSRFQVLLDKVQATELDSVTLDGDSLALIHEIKSNTNV